MLITNMPKYNGLTKQDLELIEGVLYRMSDDLAVSVSR